MYDIEGWINNEGSGNPDYYNQYNYSTGSEEAMNYMGEGLWLMILMGV